MAEDGAERSPRRVERRSPGGGRGPSPAQRAYLERGLDQPGGKLPLFDADGRETAHETIRVCLRRGWAEPWSANPIKPDWVVARLTAAGYRLLGRDPPSGGGDAS